MKMYKSSVKYLQGTNFSQLTVPDKTDIKDLNRKTFDLVISQSSSSIIQNLTLLYTLVVLKDALLGFLINNII
jgi:hypothetical protein